VQRTEAVNSASRTVGAVTPATENKTVWFSKSWYIRNAMLNQRDVQKVKYVLAIIATALLSGMSPAKAGDGLADAKWCQGDTGPPTEALATAALDPDGHPRGTRSAAVLFAEARNAARASQDDKAMAWLILCQWHNAGAQNDMRAARAAILAYLKS
jgi:hypothetical protein